MGNLLRVGFNKLALPPAVGPGVGFIAEALDWSEEGSFVSF